MRQRAIETAHHVEISGDERMAQTLQKEDRAEKPALKHKSE